MTVSNEIAGRELCLRQREAGFTRAIRRPLFRLSDIWKAPLHDFPIRDEILFQYLPFSPEMDALEIGPGSGFTAFRLARSVRSLTLVDIAPESLSEVEHQMRHLANVRCVCADSTLPGLAAQLKQNFDAAFALDVFEYLLDPGTFLRNLADVLRPNSELFFSFPNVPPPLGDGVTCFPELSALESLLGRTGFQHWEIFAVRQRLYAAAVCHLLHDWPLQVYRRLRSGNHDARPQVYDATWAFQQRRKIGRFKVPLHLFWAALEGAMRLGGDSFTREPAKTTILGQQLVIRAWK